MSRNQEFRVYLITKRDILRFIVVEIIIGSMTYKLALNLCHNTILAGGGGLGLYGRAEAAGEAGRVMGNNGDSPDCLSDVLYIETDIDRQTEGMVMHRWLTYWKYYTKKLCRQKAAPNRLR
ncbi:hypothetical protein ACFTAO_26020 [Paenibacillus rhizoplanae]